MHASRAWPGVVSARDTAAMSQENVELVRAQYASFQTLGGGGGGEVAQTMFHVFEIRDAKITRLREYLQRGQALEAAGLRE